MPSKEEPGAGAPVTSPPAPVRYRVRSGGVAGVGGVPYDTDAVLTAAQIGDQARIDTLLARGSIEVITDAADE